MTTTQWVVLICWVTFNIFLTLGQRSAYVVYVQLLSCWLLRQDFLQNCRLTDWWYFFNLLYLVCDLGILHSWDGCGHIIYSRKQNFINEPSPKIQLLFSSFSSKIRSPRVHGAHISIERIKNQPLQKSGAVSFNICPSILRAASARLIFLRSKTHSSVNWVTIQASVKRSNVRICERHPLWKNLHQFPNSYCQINWIWSWSLVAVVLFFFGAY